MPAYSPSPLYFFCEDNCESEFVTKLQGVESSEAQNLGTSNNTEVVCTHHYNPPCAGGGLEEWRLNMGRRGVNGMVPTHNTTEVVKPL